MAITPEIEQLMLAASRNNRSLYPPIALGAIGQPPFALIPAVFGGIRTVGVQPDQPLSTTPQKLTGFTAIIPTEQDASWQPEGLVTKPVSDELLILRDGVYMLTAVINATVAVGAAYRFTVYVNGEPTSISVAEDLSNQTDFVTALITAPGVFHDEDVVAIYGNSDNAVAQTFIMQDSYFFISRIR
jgi:hypothetical protein